MAAMVGTTLPAQRLGPPMARPRSAEIADTNDARAYYRAGVSLFERDPEAAAAAFYWAARIDPGFGEALYARRAALLMMDPRMLRNVFEGNERALKSDDMRRIDSLQFRALMLNPFLYRQLDRTMFVAYIRKSAIDAARRNGDGEPNAGDLDYAIENYLSRSGESTRAWLAYSDGDYPNALVHYAKALSNSRDKASVRLDRARIFKMQGQVDSSLAELSKALDEMRKKDEKDLVIFYNSKALVEYSSAVLLEGAGDNAKAREAYGRALQEDLSYYPAHMRLGLLALGAKDTATAISELALASQIAPGEPQIRYMNGFALALSRRYKDAVAELRKAVELEPYYALPYLLLGQTYEALNNGADAVVSYQKFLERATAGAAQRAYASERLSEVKEILAAIPAKP